MTHPGRLLAAAAPAALLALLLATSPAAAQTVVVLNDFEDGTAQGWIPRGGGVVLTNTEEVGSRPGGAGTHSLRTTGRTQGFHGPSLQTLGLLSKGATYQVTVWAGGGPVHAPEPGTIALVVTGLLPAVGLLRRRRAKRSG